MKQRAAVLFDMDGVLVSTEPLKAAAHSATVRRFGGMVASSFYGNVMGRSYDSVAGAFTEAAGVAIDSGSYSRVFRETYRELLENSVELTPGAADVLHSLVQKGYLLALVSSSQRWMMDRIFAKTGLDQFFDVSVCADDVHEEKPSPEAYFRALALLQLSPNRAVVVEDSETGIEAATNAGMRVLALRHRFNSRHNFSRADAVFQSLMEREAIVQTIESLLAKIPD